MTKPFTIDRMLALPRLSALRLSPNGDRLVVAVGGIAPDGKKMATALWLADPAGNTPARRLTRSAAGEGAGTAFLPDGSLLFTSSRPDPDAKPDKDGKPPHALWLLPVDGGEPRLLLAPDGGVSGVAAARDALSLAVGAAVFRGAADLEADAERAKARKDAGVNALLFEDYPIRHWDHYLGPRVEHLLAATIPLGDDAIEKPRDLDPDAAGVTFEDGCFDISADGSTIVAVRRVPNGIPETFDDLVLFDTATGASRQLTPRNASYGSPAISPDGKHVAAVRWSWSSPTDAEQAALVLIDIATGAIETLAEDADRRPEHLVWGPDSSVLYFTADDEGHHSAYRVELPSGAWSRLTASGHVADLCPTPDGASIYALRSTISNPPRIVRFDSRTADQTPVEIANGPDEHGFSVTSRVERISITAADGAPVGAWLVLPESASGSSPAPLVVFVHGGPLGSWNGWHWRWNPHILASRGFAVVLPDPALSTGYGQRMLDRGWGQWGGTPYTDVMAITDAVVARPEIDATRTALMGGSYGGYMANWVAGQTTRFRAIVTHASLWELVGFHGTTDHGPSWELEMGDPYVDESGYRRYSPRENLAAMAAARTPMLVIHGELDHRVPISEALILWTDMRRLGIPGKFLYFPDENHWILKPQNARLWYGTVLSFLDEHLNGKPFQRDPLL